MRPGHVQAQSSCGLETITFPVAVTICYTVRATETAAGRSSAFLPASVSMPAGMPQCTKKAEYVIRVRQTKGEREGGRKEISIINGVHCLVFEIRRRGEWATGGVFQQNSLVLISVVKDLGPLSSSSSSDDKLCSNKVGHGGGGGVKRLLSTARLDRKISHLSVIQKLTYIYAMFLV